jgi:hypothetical protein
MTLESRVQALLDLVDADRQRRCEAIRREAEQSAAATRESARNEARRRLRLAFSNERELREQRIAAAQAKLQTHRRLHDQRRAAALLEAGWQRLPDVLCQRWDAVRSRQQWIDCVVTEARAALRPGAWRITHAALWPAEERERVAAALTRDGSAPPQFLADAAIRAGLKISAGANVIDGTLAGLLADRADVAARLLRHMEEA